MKAIELNELQEKIHNQNVKMGWWDNPRSFETFICLFHSELSEAMEGDRKNLMDDHLPQYPMFWAEIADYVIRVLDYLAGEKIVYCDKDNKLITGGKLENAKDRVEFLAFLHLLTSSSLASENECDEKSKIAYLKLASSLCFSFAIDNNFDLLKVINEKVEYNLHRSDHQKENREKEHGKKY